MFIGRENCSSVLYWLSLISSYAAQFVIPLCVAYITTLHPVYFLSTQVQSLQSLYASHSSKSSGRLSIETEGSAYDFKDSDDDAEGEDADDKGFDAILRESKVS